MLTGVVEWLVQFNMVSVWHSSGALLLVMLIGASYSYPAKKGSDPGSSKAPSTPTASGSWVASNPARPQSVSHEEPRYTQPGVQREPAAAPSSNSFAAPVYPGDYSSATQPHYDPATDHDVTWAIEPSLFMEAQPASAQGFAASGPVGPPAPPGPTYQAGELAHMEEILEHGNYESETEEQGFPSQHASFEAGNAGSSYAEPMPFSYGGGGWVAYPYYDYMFLTGQYPPGTVSHFSSSFEQGRDNWHDSHYMRYYYPAGPSIQQGETFPVQHVKQPRQPVKSTVQGYGM